MKMGVYVLILFFISLNVSLYLMREFEVFGSLTFAPYEEPAAIQVLFLKLNVSDLMIGGVVIGAGTIVGLFTGQLVYAWTLGLILLALNLLLPAVRWVLFGLPEFLSQIGVPAPIILVGDALMAFVWFWFLLNFIGQKSLGSTYQ